MILGFAIESVRRRQFSMVSATGKVNSYNALLLSFAAFT